MNNRTSKILHVRDKYQKRRTMNEIANQDKHKRFRIIDGLHNLICRIGNSKQTSWQHTTKIPLAIQLILGTL